jgi:hypothetical protein
MTIETRNETAFWNAEPARARHARLLGMAKPQHPPWLSIAMVDAARRVRGARDWRPLP